ncbi:MAG: hypothetical protein ABIN99_01260 [Nitrosospira sp.]
MTKLYKFKSWLTIEEAARYLTAGLCEQVGEADILRLALDRRLKLSVRFVNSADVRRGNVVPFDKTITWDARRNSRGGFDITTTSSSDNLPDNIRSMRIPYSGNFWLTMAWSVYAGAMGLSMPDDTMLKLQKNVESLKGVHDLPMLGAEVLDIENRYQKLTGGPAVTGPTHVGAFIQTEAGQFCEIQVYEPLPGSSFERPWNYRKNVACFSAAGSLPSDAVLVMRPSELEAFITSIGASNSSKEKPLLGTERDSLLKLVIGMAIKGYGYDPSSTKKSTTVSEIERDLAELGIELTDDTIRKYLKEAISKLAPKVEGT